MKILGFRGNDHYLKFEFIAHREVVIPGTAFRSASRSRRCSVRRHRSRRSPTTPTISGSNSSCKGSRKNNSPFCAPRCAVDSACSMERNRRRSSGYIEDFATECRPKMYGWEFSFPPHQAYYPAVTANPPDVTTVRASTFIKALRLGSPSHQATHPSPNRELRPHSSRTPPKRRPGVVRALGFDSTDQGRCCGRY
jgi:hypothetical protein